jgi:predicted transcriptional regulator
MKKENDPDWKERHEDIERLFELGLIDIQERGVAIHQILYEEIALELDRMAKIKLEDEF